MPDPKKFDNQRDWMNDCMHQLRREEGKEQDESVAQCLNQWRDKNKKKARHVVASFLEAVDKESGIFGVPIGPPESKGLRRRQLMERQKRITHPSPLGEKEPKPKEGEEQEFRENGKWINKRFQQGKWVEIKKPVGVQ